MLYLIMYNLSLYLYMYIIYIYRLIYIVEACVEHEVLTYTNATCLMVKRNIISTHVHNHNLFCVGCFLGSQHF